MCSHRAACSQVSAVLFYAWTAKFVWAQICVGDMRVSRLQVKDRQHHLSQNIGPVIAGSAGLVPPALYIAYHITPTPTCTQLQDLPFHPACAQCYHHRGLLATSFLTGRIPHRKLQCSSL